jgi:ornithine cyclodeaminase/thiomorpholine-carboxylate dehydrogenase
LPVALAREHRLFVETMDAFAPPPVGCAELKDISSTNAATLGDVVNDHGRGRLRESEITVYKAMGVAMEDMVAANLTYRSAQRSGGGAAIDW